MTSGSAIAGAARRRAWPRAALRIVALLPVAYRVESRYLPWAIAALAAGLWLASSRNPGAPRDAVALLVRGTRGRLGAWEMSLLAGALAVCVAYVVLALRVDAIVYNDGAYYFGVARHIARSGRFEEPILWHFLHPWQTVAHAPFDYWGPAAALALVPGFWLFGDTPRVAFVSMSIVSSLTLLAFWYLVCRALPLRHCAAQMLALVVFAFTPAMNVYRFQPESIAVAQLFALAALIALCRGRSVLAVLAGFGVLLARGDGLVLFGTIGLACLAREWGAAVDRRRLGRVMLASAACLALYCTWSLIAFGTWAPPGPRLMPLLRRYWEVFDFVDTSPRQMTPPWSRFTAPYAANQLRLAFATLRGIPFAPVMDWWMGVALLPALCLFRQRREVTLTWAICVAPYFLVAWIAGPGFAPVRTPFAFAPLIVLAGALGIDAILAALAGWHGRGGRWRSVLVGAQVLGVCIVLLSRLPVFAGKPALPNLLRQQELALLDPILDGQAVMSNVPWYLIAYTRSPTVSVPFNGPAAVEAVLTAYPVDWLVVYSAPGPGGRSRPFLDDLVAGRTTDLGRFRFERIAVPGFSAALFRVRAAGAAPSR